MAKITITFLEEGNNPITLELSSETAAALDLFIEQENNYYKKPLPQKENPSDPDPLPYPPKYSGKADLFLQHTSKTLLEPIINKFGTNASIQTNNSIIQQIQQLEIQKKELEAQVADIFKPKLI